jgi:NADH:ubiquinone oxidoreductase subunit
MRAERREGKKGLEKTNKKQNPKQNIMNGRSAAVHVCACAHLWMHPRVDAQPRVWTD